MVPPDVLSRGRSGSRSPGLWSHCCRGTAKAAVLGFAKGSVSGGRDGRCLFSAFTWQIQCLVSGLGGTRCSFFCPDRGTDTAAIWFWGIRCSMCQCNVYWGLATSVACLWGASWGCDKSGWEIKYQFASREGGHSFKKQTWRMLLAVTLSPRTLCVDAALVPIRLQDIRIMNYIDDWLILAQSHQLAVRHRDVVLAHMKELGLQLNTKKSVLSPPQRTTFLGMVWDWHWCRHACHRHV